MVRTNAARIVRVDRIDVAFVDHPWPFAAENASAVADYWRQQQAANPCYFNGTVHLMASHAIADDTFHAELFSTAFANFLYWRNHGCPDTSVTDCFGSAILRARDGEVILGRQSPGNINAGLTYFPGGFIDPRDVDAGGRIDVSASVAREVVEELGFAPGTFSVQPGAYLTFIGQQVSIGIHHQSHLDATTLLRLARDFIASETSPELEDAVAVAAGTDTSAIPMPDFTRALLQELLS